MSKVAYKRVSTVDQNTDRQLHDMEFDKVFTEKCSAKTVDRPVWKECMNYLREGDTLTIHSLDRVCRSGAGDAVAIVEELTARGVGIEFVKEGMKFNNEMTAAQKGMLEILASVAQMERELIRERQLEGIKAAKAKGKTMGRPKKEIDVEEVKKLRKEGKTIEEIGEILGVSKASIYRELRKFERDINQVINNINELGCALK